MPDVPNLKYFIQIITFRSGIMLNHVAFAYVNSWEHFPDIYILKWYFIDFKVLSYDQFQTEFFAVLTI